jgi:nitrogen-specific signal transduction histidine kinase
MMAALPRSDRYSAGIMVGGSAERARRLFARATRVGSLVGSLLYVDLAALLDDLERTFRARAAAKLLTFEVQRASTLPRHIVTDATKLRQVLVNLVSNAVKFTQAGGVTVRAGGRRGDAHEVRLLVEVEDTGPGIAHEDELFRPFAQARVGIHVQGGTGLGLALSREFARLLRGDITVESHAGRGSLFRLEIPIQTGPLTEAPAPTPASRPRRSRACSTSTGPRSWALRPARPSRRGAYDPGALAVLCEERRRASSSPVPIDIRPLTSLT